MVLIDSSSEPLKDSERIILIIFDIFVALSSLIGDTAIIIGVIKYHVIKLHKAMLAVMIHLAVCDLLLTIFLRSQLSSLIDGY